MSPFDPGAARRPGAVGSAAASPVVRLIRTDAPTSLAPSASKAAVHRRSDQATARIVLGLTLTCTALSLYDLVLLASGS
jgi:hypothetical protein